MKLSRTSHAKPWGRRDVSEHWRGALATGERLGEVWHVAAEGQPQPPLLVKHLFTGDVLSVQLHPDDKTARAMGEPNGKSECWLVLEAGQGATIGLGLERAAAPDELRAAALDGSIERLIAWYPVMRGDFFFVPAGTIHAIGAGLTLIEIQQPSDITWRLYDYGRLEGGNPRALHLDEAMAVADCGPWDEALFQPIDLDQPPATPIMLGPGTPFRACFAPGIAMPWDAAGAMMVTPFGGSIHHRGEIAHEGEWLLLPDRDQLDGGDAISCLWAA